MEYQIEKNLTKVFSDLIKSLEERYSEDEIQKISEEAIELFDLNHNGKIEINEFNELMVFLIDEKGLSINDINYQVDKGSLYNKVRIISETNSFSNKVDFPVLKLISFRNLLLIILIF